MYKNLLRNVCTNVFHHKNLKIQVIRRSFDRLSVNHNTKLKGFVSNCRSLSNLSVENITKNGSPFDSKEYITPSLDDSNKISMKIKTTKEDILHILRYTYRIPENKISKLLENEKFNNWESLRKVLDLLSKKGVYKTTILNNSWILKNSSRLLNAKFDVLTMLTTMTDINDFIPLFRLSVPKLHKIVKGLMDESKLIPAVNNRLYYISKKLDLEPIVVCNYISKRLFILEMPFEMLQENLNYLIYYGVKPLSIIKDLWAFRYTPKSVQARLERAKNAKKNKIMPWMVRCPESVLQKSLQLSLDEIEILGENGTTIDYIAKRLDFDPETIKVILRNHPIVLAVRVTKIKEILDYLLEEERFSNYSIAQVPRILCHSLKTTKARMAELKSMECRPSSLVILCKSRREYSKFVRKWLESQEKIRKKKSST